MPRGGGAGRLLVKTRLFVLTLILVAATSASTFAGEDLFFIEVDALALRPTNASPDFVIVDPDDDFNVEGTIRSIEFSSTLTPRITIGTRWNAVEGLELSGWGFDETETGSVSSGDGLLWDVLSPPNISMLGYRGTATARYGIESLVLDLSYTREALSDDQYHAGFSVGLRRLEHKSSLSVTYAGSGRSVLVATRSDAKGTGLRAEAWGSMRLSRRWTITGEVSYAVLVGTTEINLNATSPSAFPSISVSGDRDRTYGTIDGSLVLVGDLGAGFTLRGGVTLSRWMDTVETPRFLDDINLAAFDTQVSDAQWAGLSLGVGFHW